MPNNGYGYDNERDKWSIEATELLFPHIANHIFRTTPDKIEYAWRNPKIDCLDKAYGTDALLQSRQRNVAIAIRIRGIYYYQSYGDITIRYDSLQTLGKMLEIQKSIARFMLYAWTDANSPGLPEYLIGRNGAEPESIRPATKFIDWHVIYLQRLVDKFLKSELKYDGPYSNGDNSSRLIGISISNLEEHKLIYKSKSKENGKSGKAIRPIIKPREWIQSSFSIEILSK